ncbi:MAG TPA: ABC transporter substrate-binding protein [Dongiaceae bacterium]|nr:ABC transporter substrate-binding protein [Dongiaceae bacterium]
MNTRFPQLVSQIHAAMLTLLAVLAFSVPAQAAVNTIPPDQLITNLFNEVTTRVKQDEAKVAADKTYLITIGNEVLVPYVSFETMAKQILGKNWRKISAEQQKRYTNAFRERVSVSIVNQYDPAKKYDLKVTGSRLNETSDRASVNSEVTERQSAKKYLISYKLYLDKKTSRWQVYDVVVEGVSVLQSFKTASAEDFKRNGIEYMIAQLQNTPVGSPTQAAPTKKN